MLWEVSNSSLLDWNSHLLTEQWLQEQYFSQNFFPHHLEGNLFYISKKLWYRQLAEQSMLYSHFPTLQSFFSAIIPYSVLSLSLRHSSLSKLKKVTNHNQYHGGPICLWQLFHLMVLFSGNGAEFGWVTHKCKTFALHRPSGFVPFH